MMASPDEDDRAAQAALMQRMVSMRQQGMTDDQIMETLAKEEFEQLGMDDIVPDDVPPSLPRAGEASWGCWSQSVDGMDLELHVPAETSGKQVAVEVQVGFLDVRLSDEPLLSGRLAQPVMSDVEWALDIRASDGQRILCIDLKKRKPDAVDALAGEALFTSLRVGGSEVGAPGLVSGVYVEEKRITAPSREAEDLQYGTYDGSVPDQRGQPGGILPLL